MTSIRNEVDRQKERGLTIWLVNVHKELGTLIRGETVIYPCYQLNSSHSHCVSVFYIHSVSSSARLNFEVVSHLIHL